VYDQHIKFHAQATTNESKALKLQIEFWNEISGKTPNAATMDRLGVDIVSAVNSTNMSYEDLMSLDQDNINALGMYSGFLKKYNNTIEFSEVLM